MQAQGNPKISVQGTLKDANGVAVEDGPQTVTFKLYHEESGGTALWEETADVIVTGGIYSHYLGSEMPLDALIFDDVVYLGVTINGFELQPRAEMTYTPYTLFVNEAGNGVPPGGILPFGGTTDRVPMGWLPCDGRAVSSQQYPRLYAAICTNWGRRLQ